MIPTRLPGAAALATLLLPVLAFAGDAMVDLAPFPAPAEGQSRLVIVLPEMSGDEANYSVELLAGRITETDGVNRVRMDTSLAAKNLEGWGYSYYEVTGSGRVSSTLMAVPEGTPTVSAFVGGTPLIVRYNSRLPIVIYLPDGFEVRYRIWAAADEYIHANPG